MGHRDRTYVIFDGDHDIWAYGYMKGWKANDRIDFDFVDAHDLAPLTARAENETYIKNRLRARLEKSTQVIVLIGDNTKNLYKFVRWEIELALELGLPVIAVNLNRRRRMDDERCLPFSAPKTRCMSRSTSPSSGTRLTTFHPNAGIVVATRADLAATTTTSICGSDYDGEAPAAPIEPARGSAHSLISGTPQGFTDTPRQLSPDNSGAISRSVAAISSSLRPIAPRSRS